MKLVEDHTEAGLPRLFFMRGYSAGVLLRVPTVVRQLDETNAALDQLPREQPTLSEVTLAVAGLFLQRPLFDANNAKQQQMRSTNE